MPKTTPTTGGVVTFECATATPHETFFVPDQFTSKSLRSPDGGYYYHADENHGCTYWVADITLGSNSNSKKAVMITANAYDLPSSEGFGGAKPTVEEDCKRYHLYALMFKKAYGETEFKLLNSVNHVEGEWQSSEEACKLGKLPTTTVTGPKVGVDVYRIAVKVILRGSAQRVQVIIGQPQSVR